MKNHSTSYSTCRFIKVRQLNQVAIKLKKKILKKSLTAGSKAKLHFLTAEVDQEE
jgi:hypothetical protein